jgi:hypothetical protein
MAACFVPPEGVLSLFDLVFNLGASIVSPDHLVCFKT